MRIGAVLLALAQLGVWGFYAPAHRLLHHSHLLVARSEPESPSLARCCLHSHQHPHCAPLNPSSTQPVPGTPDQCPDDEQHCGLCIIALHTGCVADPVALTDTAAPVERFAERFESVATSNRARPFDSRGPPSV